MPKQNNRQIGSIKEALAAAYLKQNNVEILETNFRSRCGEIDLIGRDGNYIVFFEVKYRKDIWRAVLCGGTKKAEGDLQGFGLLPFVQVGFPK